MIEIKGPFPKLKYVPNMKKCIGMMCGGTGITPMLQVMSTNSQILFRFVNIVDDYYNGYTNKFYVNDNNNDNI